MELSPHGDVLGLIRRSVERTSRVVRCLAVCVMVAPLPLGPKVVLLEIEEFPSNLESRQVEEVEDRLHLGVGQGSMQAYQ